MGQVTKAILTVSADVGFAVHVMFLMHAQGSHVDKALSTFEACNSRTCSPCGVLVKEAWVLLPVVPCQRDSSCVSSRGCLRWTPIHTEHSDRASAPCEFSCLRLGWISLKSNFHSQCMRRACRPCAASCGSTESSYLWRPFHTFKTDMACPLWLGNVHTTVCICCSVFHRLCTYIGKCLTVYALNFCEAQSCL